MRKMLLISTSYPSLLGGLRRLWHNMSHFSHSFEVHFIQVKLPNEKALAPMQLPKGVKFSVIEPKGMAFDPFFFLLSPPTWQRVLAIGSASKRIQEYIDSNGIDVVLLHPIDTSLALRHLKAKAKIAELLDSVLNYYSSKRRDCPSLQSSALEWMQKICTPMLNIIAARDFSLLVFVSNLDMPAKGKAREKSIALEARDLPVAKRNNGKRENDVVIFGTWKHPPNRDGLMCIMPDLGKINGNVLIIGSGLGQEIAAKLPKNARALGYVEDANAFLSNTKACIVPVWYGAGLQNKVFDALRQGCTVISTPFTKKTFEANGLFSDAIICTDDPVSATNGVLSNWSPTHAKNAYDAYSKFHCKCLAEENAYVEKVKRLLEEKLLEEKQK